MASIWNLNPNWHWVETWTNTLTSRAIKNEGSCALFFSVALMWQNKCSSLSIRKYCNTAKSHLLCNSWVSVYSLLWENLPFTSVIPCIAFLFKYNTSREKNVTHTDKRTWGLEREWLAARSSERLRGNRCSNSNSPPVLRGRGTRTHTLMNKQVSPWMHQKGHQVSKMSHCTWVCDVNDSPFTDAATAFSLNRQQQKSSLHHNECGPRRCLLFLCPPTEKI